MVYVFDTNSFRVLGSYYPKQFRTFWGKFDQYVAEHKVISVREVRRELEEMLPDDSHLANWVKHIEIFFYLLVAMRRNVLERFYRLSIFSS